MPTKIFEKIANFAETPKLYHKIDPSIEKNFKMKLSFICANVDWSRGCVREGSLGFGSSKAREKKKIFFLEKRF
jgi:hypothetical protein